MFPLDLSTLDPILLSSKQYNQMLDTGPAGWLQLACHVSIFWNYEALYCKGDSDVGDNFMLMTFSIQKLVYKTCQKRFLRNLNRFQHPSPSLM